jgi:hypothetical protein
MMEYAYGMYETWNRRRWLVAHDNINGNKARNTIAKAWKLTQNKAKQVQNMTKIHQQDIRNLLPKILTFSYIFQRLRIKF